MADKHVMYYYNTTRGAQSYPCAKCLCGLEMEGDNEIEEHEMLIEGDRDV